MFQDKTFKIKKKKIIPTATIEFPFVATRISPVAATGIYFSAVIKNRKNN